MPAPSRMATVADWIDDDQIEFARDTLGPAASDDEVQQLAAERAQVMYDEMVGLLLADPDRDLVNRKLASLADTSATTGYALDELNRCLYDPSSTSAFVSGDELTNWLGDHQTDPVLTDLAGQDDNSRFWKIIGHAKDQLISELVGRRLMAGPHGGTDYVIAARPDGDGIELRPAPHASRTPTRGSISDGRHQFGRG